MKKIILTMLLVMAFGFTNAQKAQFGIKAGLNSSNFSGDTEGADFKSRIGFNIGAFVAIKLSEKITLQPEVLYSTQGAKVENVSAMYNGVNYTGDVKFNFSYINVPIMLKYYVADKFNLEVGPQIGFLASAKTSTKIDGFSQKTDQDVKDFFETVDVALNFGAGYDFTEKFFAGIRYNLGVSNIFNSESGGDSKSQNSVFSLSVGYKF